MAKIEFSPVFATGLPSRLAGIGQSTYSLPSPSAIGFLNDGYLSNSTELHLFKGTRPTKAEMISSRNLGTAGTPFRLALGNNILVRFINSINNNTSLTLTNNNILTINTSFVAAEASGSATWFCLFHTTSGLSSGSFGNFITGDVGITGSGADIEIPDTNLTSGELYRILGWKLKFPSSWEY